MLPTGTTLPPFLNDILSKRTFLRPCVTRTARLQRSTLLLFNNSKTSAAQGSPTSAPVCLVLHETGSRRALFHRRRDDLTRWERSYMLRACPLPVSRAARRIKRAPSSVDATLKANAITSSSGERRVSRWKRDFAEYTASLQRLKIFQTPGALEYG